MENWHSVETQKDIERLMLTTNRVGYCRPILSKQTV